MTTQTTTATAPGPGPATARKLPAPRRDELHHAKLMLLQVDESAPSMVDSLAQSAKSHPYAAAALALGAGLMLGRGSLGRKFGTIAGAWLLKKVIAQLTLGER